MNVYNIEFRVKPNSRLMAFIDYLFIRRTPSRILCDDCLVQLAPMLRGTVIELGGYKNQNIQLLQHMQKNMRSLTFLVITMNL